MWWLEVPTTTFEAVDGKSYPIKVFREIPEYPQFVELVVSGDEKIDEIASRENIYGEAMEINSYAVFEANVIKLVENNFDISKMNKLKIPVLE